MKSQDKHTQTISLEAVEKSLYTKGEKVYSRKARGLFSNLKALSGFVLLGIFYLFPWIMWGDRQAVLFDLPARKFYIFDLVFWPQDLIYLAFLLILAGLSLFFFTALAGRLWCGFACPQTIWTDIFIWMERLVEGDRPQQMKLDKQPLSWRKFRIKATKHTLWIGFSLITGFTFVGFFTPVHELWDSLLSFNLSGWEGFWLFFYGFATYGNAGWLREQVCIYMCPYARFQSSMFDKDTMIIAYDENRGESRGARKRGADPKELGLGDCVDCTLCVQVCPTGIDIRDGLQYQCISCSACIDVCNEVMDKLEYPRSLISYTTEHKLKGEETHIIRPRMIVYGVMLVGLFLSVAYFISQRIPVDLDVIRDRNMLYTEENSGDIKNLYVLRIMNKDEATHSYQLNVEGIQGLRWETDRNVIKVESGTVLDLPVSLHVNPSEIKERTTDVHFTLTANEDGSLQTTEKASFIGPVDF